MNMGSLKVREELNYCSIILKQERKKFPSKEANNFL